MKVNELRIGNYLNVLGKDIIVESISYLENRKDMFWIHTSEFIPTKIFHFRPIQLTEEWVLKFEEFSKTDKEGTPCFFNGDNIMLFDRGGYFDAYLHSEFDGSVFFATRLFYVHQLQNFYYSIEKNELTIKE